MKRIYLGEKKDKLLIFLNKHKNKFSWGTFLVGFLFDVFTLNRIDALYGNLVLGFYLFLAIFLIFLINWGDYRGIKNKFVFKLYQYAPFALQFSFGALLSGFVVYYTTSATFYNSWPFLLALYLFFILNEKIEKYYERFEFQMAVFFLALFSFSIFFLPILTKRIGDKIFIASGALSVLFIFWLLRFIYKILPVLKRRRWKVIRNIFVIFVVFNLSYFYNIIPPVPLSAKRAEIVHWAGRNEEGKYELIREKRKWNDFKDRFYNIYYRRPGEKVYFFVSVFAPTDLKTKIIHRWQYYDPQKKEWINYSKTSYQITGGRGGGYRGYSYISKAKDGKWRVSVETPSGLLINREYFEVKNIDKNLNLKTEVLK